MPQKSGQMRADWKTICSDWDVTGDLFTINTRREIEKRFLMFYF